MNNANLIMLGIGVVALIGGMIVLLRRGGSEASIYARRIAGTMAAALGLTLILFAIGLAGAGPTENAQ